MMNMLFDTESGSSFSIDVDFSDSVLMLKQKIEKSQGIPVFKQTLSFEGNVLQDDYYYVQRQFPNYTSRLFLSISPDDNPNQNNNDQVPQTEQSPSNPVLEFANNQDRPVMSNNDQDSTKGKNKQVLHQTEQSPLLSNSFGDMIYVGGRTLTLEQAIRNQRYRPLQMITARRIDNGSSLASYSLEELLGPKELVPVMVGSRRKRNQEVVQTEEPSSSLDPAVNKKRKTSPTELRVFVHLIEDIGMMIPMKVKANDNVEELRKELVKRQEKGELNLPQEGYRFIVGGETLNETESFTWNLVVDGDTIDIVRDQA